MAEEIITSTNAETATDHEYNASGFYSATSPELRLSSAFLLKRCKGTNHFLTCKLFRKKILEKYIWK